MGGFVRGFSWQGSIAMPSVSIVLVGFRFSQPWANKNHRFCAAAFFPQHLVEGLLNFRRRVCRSFLLDLAFQDPLQKTD